MTSDRHQHGFRHDGAHRPGLGIAGLVIGLAWCAAVLALFAQASPSHWLRSSPEAIAAVEACRQHAQRAAGDACVREVVAQWQAAERRETMLASKR